MTTLIKLKPVFFLLCCTSFKSLYLTWVEEKPSLPLLLSARENVKDPLWGGERMWVITWSNSAQGQVKAFGGGQIVDR